MDHKYLYWHSSPVFHEVKKYTPHDPLRSKAWCGQSPFISGGVAEELTTFANIPPANKTKCKGCINAMKAIKNKI